MSELNKGDLNVQLNVMKLFWSIQPHMPASTIMAFLFVATRGRCHQKDVENEFQINDAMASRAISFWCVYQKGAEKGIGFIDRREDPMDRRYKLLTLKAFASKLRLGQSS